MTTVGVHEAKTRLSELLRAVEAGEEVIVTRGGQAVARIVPAGPPPEAKPIARFGLLADRFGDTGDWDDEEWGEEMGDLFGIPRRDPT